MKSQKMKAIISTKEMLIFGKRTIFFFRLKNSAFSFVQMWFQSDLALVWIRHENRAMYSDAHILCAVYIPKEPQYELVRQAY